MPRRVLVVNAGSSSLKLRVLDGTRVTATRDLAAGAGGLDRAGLTQLLAEVEVDAVGHRVVHGGTRFTAPTLLDDDVRAALRDLCALAPLHQPSSLAGIDAVGELLPGTPAVACFDTAFHATLPEAASTYALPEEWRTRWGVRRFGFHGLSHAYAARRAAELVGRDAAALRVVTCHLGAGASLCAVAGGRSVDTTMGFTPLEGLVMATRSGTVDPGLLLWLQSHAGLTSEELEDGLERRSGLLGLGGSSDAAVLVDRAAEGDARAALALEVWVHRVVAGVAAMTASLGGLDVLVLTGGVGENSAPLRAAIGHRLAFLGVALDPGRNNRPVVGDADVGADGAGVRTLVVAAREDLEIARGVVDVLGGDAGSLGGEAGSGGGDAGSGGGAGLGGP